MLITHIGPMFSEKTTSLIRDIELLELTGLDCIVFTPKFDTRKASTEIITHNNKRRQAVSIANNEEVLQYIDNFEVFAFDEIQFYDNCIVDIIKILLKKGKHVIIAGLDTDFNQKMFGITMELVAIADNVIKHRGKCDCCNAPSLFSFKKEGSFSRLEVGAADKYVPVCRNCFELLTLRKGI